MRTKKALLTLITDLLPQLLLAVIGLVKSHFFIANLGTDMNGLYSNYAQIMKYITIVDGGLASAILYRLYKPVAEEDYDKVSSILSGSRRIFQIIAFMVLGIGIAVSFLVPFIIKDNPFDYFYVQGTFMLYLLSSIFSYFTISHQTVFEAHQRKYITNVITQTIMVLKGILEIVVIVSGLGFIGILVLFAISNFLTSLLIYIVAKKSYPNVAFKKKEKSYEILGDVKHLLVHKIGTIVASNIDTLIITATKGLTSAAIYGQYMYIVNSVGDMVGKLNTSAIAGVGDLISRDKEKSYHLFKEFNALSFFIATVICVPLFLVINSFIQIWHEGRIETSPLLALAFVLNLLYFIIRMPTNTYVNSAGLFKETKICPIIESVVNLILSFALIQVMGLPGVLFATFIAYLASDYFIRPIIVYQKLFKVPVKGYYIRNLFYLLIMVVLALLWMVLLPAAPTTSYGSWFIYSCMLFVVNAAVALGIYVVTKQAYFLNRIKALIRKKEE